MKAASVLKNYCSLQIKNIKKVPLGRKMKTKIVALLVVWGIAFAPTYAAAQVCAGGLIVAALIVNATQHRELTEKEAATCGFILDMNKPVQPAPAPAVKSTKKKDG
jgi:hypothetical protein